MRTENLKHLFTLCIVVLMGISACTKDDPVPEENQEEYDSTEIVLTNQQDPEDVLTVTFDKDGHPSPHHIHLATGASYAMEITLFYKGKSINEEVLEAADEHQFFFLGSPQGVFKYTYDAQRTGLTGTLDVLTESESFEWNLVLRHGLDKSHAAAQDWNSSSYAQAGGSDDLNIAFEVHPSAGDHEPH